MVSVYKMKKSSSAALFVGEPTPRVTWLKGGHDVSITTRATKSVKDNHHTLVIRGASFTDSGTYTVEAKNSHGTVRAYCSVKVRETYRCRSFSPRGQDEMYVTTSYEDQQRRTTGRFIRDVPGKVGTPKAHDIGKNWVSLQWTRPEHTGGVMVTAYKVESWILGEEARWQDLGVTPIPSFDVYHLKQDREYLFRVTPRNKYGWGEAVMTPRPIRIGRKIEHPNFPRCLPHQVRAMPGGCISLDAQVTGEPMPEIRWYKDGTVIDVERYPRFSSHCSEGSMHHIFGFLCKVSLRIQDLQWEDEGKYEIEVLNPGGRVTSYTRVNTTNDCSILEAQERINNNLMALSRLDTVPSMAPQFTMRLRDRRVQVGFPVRLTCQIVGVPRPTVSWFKDGETLVIDDCHTTWQEDGHFYTLEISNSTHDDAAIYSACASNLYGSVLCKCRLIVDSGLKSYISPMFLRELEDQSVRQGETITLQTVIEAYPTIGVVWHRDGQRIRISRKHSFSLDADGIASLVIRKADYTDGGLYTCTASNEMGHIESICRVSVSCTDSDLASGRRKIPKYSNEPIFVRKPRAIDAEEGDLVIIECEVMGEPKPTVTWLRDWLEPSVYSDGDRFQEIGTGPVYRLEIPNCRLEDTGAYSILAKNDHGETRAVVSVQVYAKGLKGELEGTPVKRGVMEYLPVVTRPLQDVRCCDGDSVTLEALVEAPKSSIIRWEKQGKVLKLGGDIESEWDGSRVRLKIREVYPEDEGEYSCIIFNDMGKAVTSATLIVEMADDKENDVTVQMEHRPDLSRRTTPSRTNTPSRWSRSPSVNFQREGSAHSWAGVGWREPSVSVPHWRPLSRGSSPLLLARRFTPEPSTRSKSRSHRPKFYYIPHDRIVEEGETVSFQCAVKGNPVPRASWDKDNMKILEGGRIKFEERDEVRTLEIPKVTQQDAGLYRVTIENELGREQATARLDVIKSSGNKYAGYVRAWNTSPLTAPQFARRMPSTPVSEGSRLTLRADYRGSPLPRAKWYRNGELLPLCDDFPQTYNGRQAVLEVPEVTTADAGTYSCVLENDVGKTECSCEVIVEHRNEAENTPPYIIQGLKDLTVLDGDEVRLSIRVGGSLPLKVVWVRNDLEIKPSKDFRYEEEGNGSYSLFLRDVYPDDAGIYICEAYNMHGEAHSYCKMTVHDPRAAKSSAPCIVGNLTPLVVEEGSAARFTVAVHGHPAPTLSWFLDGRKLMSTPRVKVEVDEDVGPDEGHQHTLSIVHALSTDSGVLSVVASNCLGTDSASTTLKVNLYAPNREDRFKSSANSPSSVSTNVQSRLTPPRTSNSPAPRIKPMLKEISNTGTGSVDSAYGSSSLRDSSGCSSSLSNVSELEYDSITKEQHQHEMSQKLLQTVESHKEEEEEEEEEEAEPDLDEEDEELAVGCEADSDEVGAEIISGPVDVTVLKGQSATLTASYTGKPEPLVSWLKKEQEICDGGRYSVKTENGITTLIIHDIVQEDCDKYTVVVRNSLGAHAAFASLAVGSAPEPPADKPNHSEVTDDSVTLSWYGPTYDGGSVVTGYIVEAHKIGNGDWFTLISGCHSTSYIAQGLDTNCQYEFRVRAQNIHGVSEPSKPSIPVTTSAPPDKDDEPEPEDHETAFAPLNVEIEAGANFDKQYKMHEEVGKGRFGIVYRVTDKITGTRRAAKVIKCIKSTDKEKVREEISIMNALRHPKLLQLGAAYERQKEIIMVMEYISGGELFERVVADDFALTERDCILFVRQICEGVAYMHKSHIVHLDLKPENILCVRRTSHQIKLIDFGLARRFNPDDPCRVLFGTPEFIAPEIINYELIGFSSDMWSVGVICYVLLSGLSPFMGDNDAETFANITRAEFDFDDDAFTAITEDAKDFIRSLLIKKKEKRLTAEQCFDHPWLAQTEEDMNKVVLSTDKLKKFIIRRKWQKTGNAIRALGRITHLANRRSSQPSSPTRLSPLPENQAHTPTSPSTPPPTNSPGLNSLSKTKGCPPVTRSSGSVISERSDSGRNILQSGKTPSLDWQSSVDSAVCDDDYISKSGFGSSQRKISREALLVKSAAADSMINAHSRI
ncbi:myosin light chain kinase, smooth muscle-like isoform X3 [Macrobrachium nipponense]|uniref:myosin light chain kinase, smooth muscle-like isoform X3 n=1 Tax=Macrobrachium nipponense TaxID=159736 RepID=UPI0030C800F6